MVGLLPKTAWSEDTNPIRTPNYRISLNKYQSHATEAAIECRLLTEGPDYYIVFIDGYPQA